MTNDRHYFVDSDGVIADFDRHYLNLCGNVATRWPDPDGVDWKKVNQHPNFFATIPFMPDAMILLTGLGPRPWSILTGCPASVDVAANQKIDWYAARFNPPPRVICCRSREKCLHGKPGDVLIDDYLKYKHLWVKMGGIFIHHTSAKATLAKLERLGL